MNMKKIIDEIINGIPDVKEELVEFRNRFSWRINQKNKDTSQLSFIDKLGGQECKTLKKNF